MLSARDIHANEIYRNKTKLDTKSIDWEMVSTSTHHSHGFGGHHFCWRQNGQVCHVDHQVTNCRQWDSNHYGPR